MQGVLLALVGFVCSGFALTALLGAQQVATPGDAVLVNRRGVPLSQLLLSDSRAKGPVVVVQKDGPTTAGLVSPPLGMGQLEWMASIVPDVLVIRVEQVAPRLTTEQDWIVSDVKAIVETVVKQPSTEPFGIGETITFVQDGGELPIAGRLVRAIVPYADSLAAGNRYLLFANRLTDGALNVYEPTNYLIDSQSHLHSLAKGDRWPNSENGVTLAEALRRIIASIKNDQTITR